jgi:hypothetical protein
MLMMITNLISNVSVDVANQIQSRTSGEIEFVNDITRGIPDLDSHAVSVFVFDTHKT